MKILHLSNNLGSGGSEKLLTDILPLMKAKGHQVSLAYANGDKNVPAFEKTLQDQHIPIHDFKLSAMNPMLLFRLIKLLNQERYDIVHAHIFPTQYWLALAAYFRPAKTRLVKTEHSVFNNRRKNYLQRLEKIIYAQYACIIAVTPEVAKALQEWVGYVTRIQVILSGVNLEAVAKAKAHSFPYTFLIPGCYHILMTGRFNGTAKDQATLIRAMQWLPKNFHVYFAGEGELLPKAKQLADDLRLTHRVHFLGMRSDVYQLMHQVDLNVLSSTYEGLSGVALESMAAGKPFLGTAVDGIWNVVPDQRYLFPVGQAEVLAARIQELADNPALSREMAQKGVEHVQQYDINQMVSSYLESYKKVQS